MRGNLKRSAKINKKNFFFLLKYKLKCGKNSYLYDFYERATNSRNYADSAGYWNNGNENAKEKLLPFVYNELKRQARFLMSKERLESYFAADGIGSRSVYETERTNRESNGKTAVIFTVSLHGRCGRFWLTTPA